MALPAGQGPDVFYLEPDQTEYITAGFIVPLWQADIADRIEQVSTEEAKAMTMRLAREEGVFAGTSTGANVIAALRLAEGLGPGATVVTTLEPCAHAGQSAPGRVSADPHADDDL